MHQQMLRAACRSVRGSRYLERQCRTTQKSMVERAQPSLAFSSSQDYYNFGWRDQSGTKFAQLQIVNALQLGDRNKASELLFDLSKSNGSLSAKDFAYVLSYCAKTPDPSFVMETWKVMEERAVGLNESCCKYITQAFSKGGYVREALNWLKYLGEGVHDQGSLPMYNIILSECTSSKRLTDAHSCLEFMDNELMGKSEITYWELLKLAVSQNNISTVHDIWKECTKYYSPSILLLRKFIWSFTRLSDLESSYSVLQHMVSLANRDSFSIRKSAAGRYQLRRLDIPVPAVKELQNNSSGLKDSGGCLNENVIEPKEELKRNCMELYTSIETHPFYNTEENLKDVTGSLSNTPNLPVIFSETPARSCFNDLENVKKEECLELDLDNKKHEGPWSNTVSTIRSVQVNTILRWSFSDIINSCARSKNSKLAEQLFQQMLDLGLKPSKHTYAGLIKAVIYGKGVAHGMKMIAFMEKRNVKPNNDTLAALSIGYSKALQLDLAEELLEKVSDNLPKYIHPFNAFFTACDIMDEPERAARLLGKLKSLNIKPNIRTYEVMFSLFGNVNAPYERGNMFSYAEVTKRIRIIEMDMLKNGIQHSYKSMMNLIRALGDEGMLQEMLQYLTVAENMLWHTNSYQTSDMYDVVLHALVKAKESDRATEVFKNMRLFGSPASVATYNIMIECCCLMKCFRSASALVSMMIRHGFFPTTITYTALVKVHLANGDFNSALHLLDQSSSEGIQPDIQLCNELLLEADSKERIDVIEHIIEYIHKRKIQPNPSTCWYTFSAYLKCGFHNTAFEALQVLSMRMISEEDRTLQEYRAEFEHLIYDEDPDAELRIIDVFEDSQEYLATALLNLRWCSFAGFSVSWRPDESPWAQRISSSYGT